MTTTTMQRGRRAQPATSPPAHIGTSWRPRPVSPPVWVFRILLLIPFVLMGPEVVAAVQARPEAVAHLSASVADVLGTSSFIIFALMMAVTPIHTISGWRWHIVLRRDYGIGMFAVAFTDLIIAAITTGDQFQGGFLSRVVGHSFLTLGTLSTLLLVPLVLTANRRAQRALGMYWRRIHRVTYVVWVTILIHLLLLFGFRGLALNALEVSASLLTVRLPPIRNWCEANRRAGSHRITRLGLGSLLTAVFLIGLTPFVQALATTGIQAITQHPVDN